MFCAVRCHGNLNVTKGLSFFNFLKLVQIHYIVADNDRILPIYMLLFQIMLTFNMSQLKPVSYGAYQYPLWAILIGWIIGMTSVVPIPIQAVIGLCKSNGSLLQVRLNLHCGHWTHFTLCYTSNMWHLGRPICFQQYVSLRTLVLVYIEITIFDRFYFTWHHA